MSEFTLAETAVIAFVEGYTARGRQKPVSRSQTRSALVNVLTYDEVDRTFEKLIADGHIKCTVRNTPSNHDHDADPYYEVINEPVPHAQGSLFDE